MTNKPRVVHVSHVATMQPDELRALRTQLHAEIADIRLQQARHRVACAEHGTPLDQSTWYQRAGIAARMRGRVLSTIDARLANLREAAHAAQDNETANPTKHDLFAAAGALRKFAADGAGDPEALERVAAFLRRHGRAK